MPLSFPASQEQTRELDMAIFSNCAIKTTDFSSQWVESGDNGVRADNTKRQLNTDINHAKYRYVPKTIDVGKKALIFNHKGEGRIEHGPQRIFLWRERFIRLPIHTADQNEYLIITHRNGNVEHKPGPCVMFQNPLEHDKIDLGKGTNLDANEVLVVYRQDISAQMTTRYLVHGPTLFIPQANEWLHEFAWTGTAERSKTQKVSGSLRFHKLRVIPDQFYYNVDEVRTRDDALMRVKLMMFFELNDIELMLSTTADPINDFINCLHADVIAFCSAFTYLEFMECASDLNKMENYPNLLDRCKKMGYTVSKVAFRGYFASPTLQQMHDKAISTRTKIKMEHEKEEQEQQTIDMSLRSEMERISMEQSMEIENLKHKQTQIKSQLEHELNLNKEKHTEVVRQTQREELAKLEAENGVQGQELEYLGQLHDLKVDLTPYLLSQEKHPQKIVRVVNGQRDTQLHLHHS